MSTQTECITLCFRCGKNMKVGRDENGYMDKMISDGLFFQAEGNYGSTVFDPSNEFTNAREFLEIVICDDCVRKHQNCIDHVREKYDQQFMVALFETDKVAEKSSLT